MYNHISVSLKKSAASIALFSILFTSLPVGVLEALAEEIGDVVTEVVNEETITVEEESEDNLPDEEVIEGEENEVIESDSVAEEAEQSTDNGSDIASSTNDEESDETTNPIVEFIDSVTDSIQKSVSEFFKDEPTKVELVMGADGVAGIDPVELGVTYVFPQNDQVQVTFTELPENPGSLSIVEVLLSDEQVKAIGAVSNVAYDITSNMENGTFAYDLKLPVPEELNEVSQVVYAESVEELSNNVSFVENKHIELISTENSVSVKDLNHFTVFVVTSFTETQVTGPEVGYNGIWFTNGASNPINRVPSGTNSISSSVGNYHGEITDYAFTRWDGYKSTFPSGGYDTRVDVYVDMALATGSVDKRFDFSSAISNTSGGHQRDFIFHLGTNPSTAGEWLVSASNNSPGWPGNPANNPLTLDESGWYTLEHEFKDVAGVLEVTFNIYKKGESIPLSSWVRSNPADVIGSTVGGNRYGWFVRSDFDWLAIDQAEIEYTTDVGSLDIVSYNCPIGTVVSRAANGVGGTVPSECWVAMGDTFGYVHGTQTDANPPYPELGAQITEAGATDMSGELSKTVKATGRYLVMATDGVGGQLPANEVLGLYCDGDADTSGNNDNQELTFVPVGSSTDCVAYMPAAPGTAPVATPVKPTLVGEVIYDATPATLPASVPSLGYQATQTYELGDKIIFAPGTGRDLISGAVTLTSWACETGEWNLGNCSTTPGATFSHPVTLNIYNVAGDGTVGTLIASTTETFDIPYRPSANPDCNDGRWKDTTGGCFNGYNHVVVFDLSGITVPDSVVYGVAYDTQSYGAMPTGINGPYNALNVGFNTDNAAPYIGTDMNSDELFWDTTYPGYTRGLKADSGWSPNKVSITFTAESLVPSSIINPAADGDVVSGTIQLEAYYADENNDGNDGVQWAVRAGSCSTGTVLGNVDTRNDPFTWTNGEDFVAPFDTTQVANGNYCFVFNPSEDAGDANQRLTREFTVDNGSNPPVVTIETPTPLEGSYVRGTITGRALATDDVGMGSYYLRFWKDAFEIAGGGTLVHGCQSAPGGDLLGTSQDVSCTFDTTTAPDGTYVFSAQFQDSDIQWGQALRTFIVDNTAPDMPVHEFPANNSSQNFNDFYFNWSDVTDAVSYEVQYSRNSAVTGAGGSFVTVDWTGDYQGNQPTVSEARSVGASGTWYWQVRAVDAVGNQSDWTSPWMMTIDMVAPAVPDGLGWNDSNGNPVADGGTTDLASGTAVWDANTETDFSHYTYKYWNDISTSAYNGEANAWVANNIGTNSLGGVFNQGEGTHYFCIMAVDMAGNSSVCSEEFTVIYETTPVTPVTPTASSTTQVINGNTAGGENQPGWLFNRDTSTQSPYQFVLGTSSIGVGSLFVQPITNTVIGNGDKFIGELFLMAPIEELSKISYDFNIAEIDSADADQFYVNLYTNFGVSSPTKYYDCRYDIVPTAGVVDGWTTVSINPSTGVVTGGSIAHVQQHGSSPFACPATPNLMDSSSDYSIIRAVALTAGDSTAGDMGVSGYFDNVVVVQTTGSHTQTTVYDFEPTSTTPPDNGNDDDNGDSDASSVSGGSTGGSNSGPTPTVLGASTDNDMQELLENIKDRLTELLLASYTTPESPAFQGTVYGASVAQAQTNGEVDVEAEVVVEEASTSTPTTLSEEVEEAVEEMANALPWSSYAWIFVVLWLLSTAAAFWRRSVDPQSTALRVVQVIFGAIALVLLAAFFLVGLAGVFWSALIVAIGAMTTYFWTLE